MDNSDLQVLIEELKLIRDNVHGRLKQDSSINLTHSEVISFARTFVKAFQTGMIDPFSRWDNPKKKQVIFYMNLICTYGIQHCDRSRVAKKCLDFIDQQIIDQQKKKLDAQLDTQNDDNSWNEIPF